MKLKAAAFFLLMFFPAVFPCVGQTLLGEAAGDFYSAFAKMGIDEKRLDTLEDLRPYISEGVFARLNEDIIYRTAFIAYAVNQHGVISGGTSSSGFAETLTAITGFFMLLEESGEPENWTVKEISDKYGQLIASSWYRANQPLFVLILEAYCSYMRGELWRAPAAVSSFKQLPDK